jgi:hypothetical protein
MKKFRIVLIIIVWFFSFTAVAQKLPSADAIITRYVKVIGGEKQWSAIKTSEFHATAMVGDKSLEMLIIKAGSGKFFQSLTGEGISSIAIYDSGQGVIIENGNKQEMKDFIHLDHYQLQACMLPDMNYKQLHYKRELMGIKNINGAQCYEISLTSENGSTNINYYEKKSGLLIMIEKSGVKTLFADYRSYKGCFIPFFMSTDLGEGYSMKIKVTDWLVNEKSSAELFETKKQQLNF